MYGPERVDVIGRGDQHNEMGSKTYSRTENMELKHIVVAKLQKKCLSDRRKCRQKNAYKYFLNILFFEVKWSELT
jgi:hypothetical protein